MKKIVNATFIVLLVLFLFMGLVKTIFFPREINELENRYANKIEAFTLENFLDGSFQKKLGDALNDQVPLSTTMKKAYNFVNSYYENTVLSMVMKGNKNSYASYKGGLLFGNHIVYATNVDEDFEQYKIRFENIASQVKKHEDIKFYIYYIEKDTDIDFVTNVKIDAYDYFGKQFQSINVPYSGFKVDNYQDFSENFYKTDHHWNCYGSYKAYGEVMQLLGVSEKLVPITGEHLLDYDFSGSKAIAIGATGVFKEKFPAYSYNYPDMKIMINDQVVDDYGMQDEYLREEPESIAYGSFYGGDDAKIIFDTNNTEKENVLVIGESYDNAILKLIASHFHQTHSIDLRYYQSTYGEEFSFSSYLEENDIDKVLLIGNLDYFTMEEFMLED